MTVVGNLSRAGGKTATDHAVSSAGWLSGAVAKQTEAEDISLGITIDQVLAKQIGQDTPFPSLEFATEDFSGYVGGCVPGYSCTYMNTISWAGETSPLPMEINPRVAFERMFGRAGDAETAPRRACARTAASSIRWPARRGSCSGGSARRIAPGSTSISARVREIERRIEKTESRNAASVTAVTAPVGVPEAFEDHAALMFDLLAVAYQADLTRVFTFMMAREASQRTYPALDIPETHHDVSHHGNQADKMALHAKIDTHFATLFANFVEKLRAVARGRRLGARSLADRVRRRHERRPGALGLPAAAGRDRRRERRDEGQPLHRGQRVDAGRQLLAERRRHLRQPDRAVRREHRPREPLMQTRRARSRPARWSAVALLLCGGRAALARPRRSSTRSSRATRRACGRGCSRRRT